MDLLGKWVDSLPSLTRWHQPENTPKMRTIKSPPVYWCWNAPHSSIYSLILTPGFSGWRLVVKHEPILVLTSTHTHIRSLSSAVLNVGGVDARQVANLTAAPALHSPACDQGLMRESAWHTHTHRVKHMYFEAHAHTHMCQLTARKHIWSGSGGAAEGRCHRPDNGAMPS